MTKHPIITESAPPPLGTYSQAIKVDNAIYLSGQIPLHPKTQQLVSNEFTEQAEQVFLNLKSVAQAAGGNLDSIVRLTIYLIDLSHFPIVNEMMSRHFKQPYPARTTFQVSGLPKQAQIEIDAIMYL